MVNWSNEDRSTTLDLKVEFITLEKLYTCSLNSVLIRNLLGYPLLSSQKGENAHNASRCCIVDPSHSPNKEGSKSAFETLGARAVVCFASGSEQLEILFPNMQILVHEWTRGHTTTAEVVT